MSEAIVSGKIAILSTEATDTQYVFPIWNSMKHRVITIRGKNGGKEAVVTEVTQGELEQLKTDLGFVGMVEQGVYVIGGDKPKKAEAVSAEPTPSVAAAEQKQEDREASKDDAPAPSAQPDSHAPQGEAKTDDLFDDSAKDDAPKPRKRYSGLRSRKAAATEVQQPTV